MANSSSLSKVQSTASGRRRRTYDALEYTRNRMGLKPVIETRPGTHGDPELSWWPRMRLMFREPLLEFWGTLVMMLLGGSVTAITYLSNYQNGNWLTICLGWSAAMIFGIYVAGDSGAYLNPAITLTNCLFRGLPLRRWPVYASAQLLGAFCAHGLVYGNYISAIDQYEGHAIRTIPPSSTTSAKIFCQFPQPFVPIGSQIFSEFISNFFTTFLILAVRDENGADLKGGGFFIIAFFWLNFVVMAAFGWETGSPINPARDLAGRTWLAILGYKNAWSAYNYYFWIPTFVPFIACFFGALAYDIFIYTGDSPLNNGAWSYSNFRKGTTQLWNCILVKSETGPKRRQSDEESLSDKQGRDNLTSKSITEKEESKPSRNSAEGEQQHVNEKGVQKGEANQSLEEKKAKETGYDDPEPGAEEYGGEEIEKHGN
ncbi:aquaporin-3 [Diaporthe amygdali]|uniref:aquaporin-3 n=1 Tax=Phomopsis amygdali TaxID=1214568 RepID=UPI0022FECC7F|nr:aquaporin-3 [Diaporthe amygdali]KAJ0119518.1 aquaporin-3 [Diaporthe amygdali]